MKNEPTEPNRDSNIVGGFSLFWRRAAMATLRGAENFFKNIRRNLAKDTPSATVNQLYIPGGGMLGILPAMNLAYLEHVTDTPTSELFQAMDGASTGAMLCALLNIRDPNNPEKPLYSAEDMFNYYCIDGPKLFPDIPHRVPKMAIGSLLNVAEDFVDPYQTDGALLREIQTSLENLQGKAQDHQKGLIKELEALAMTRWITEAKQTRALEICEALVSDSKNPMEEAGDIGEMVFVRQKVKTLNTVYRKAALKGMDLVRKNWANGYMFDTSYINKRLDELCGDARMNDALNSLYIWVYDMGKGKAHPFYVRKENAFDKSPDGKAEVAEGNVKIKDAIMGTIANSLAFPAHQTEDGIICDDMAIVHTPLWSVHDLLKNRKDRDQKIRFIAFGTGTHVSKDISNKAIQHNHERHGMIGEMVLGRSIQKVENYANSQARDILWRELGKENILGFTPRLSPRTAKDVNKAPSINILNGSPDNIRRIYETGMKFLDENEERLKDLGRELVTNLYYADKISRERLEQLLTRIDKETYRPKLPPLPDEPAYKAAAQNDNQKPGQEQKSDFISRTRSVIKSFFNSQTNPKAAEEQNNSQPATDKKKDRPRDRRGPL